MGKWLGFIWIIKILKGEKDNMVQQQLLNFQLFDAPVGLFFTVHKALGIGAKMDITMMIQNVMLAAKARGLDTYPKQHGIIFIQLCLKCFMSLQMKNGHAHCTGLRRILIISSIRL